MQGIDVVLSTLDLIVVAVYAILLFGIAQYVSREPKGTVKSTEDYFLAGKSLPWWAIGASLIAANISAEQITGQSADGFLMGLAIAAYEWQAAIVLIIVAKFFLPIFLERKIYTMPQFLETRYGPEVKTLMSVFWIFLYVAVNLTALLWLGAVTIERLTGVDEFWAMAALGAFALAYSLYGGLKAVALTDIIQVVILIAGGIILTWISLDLVGGEAGGPMDGLKRMTTEVPGHFKMIFSSDNEYYDKLPGIWTLLGGLWVLHFSYWGFNQYIIQRALGAESLQEAQKGLTFAAFLKILIPFIVVIPGIAALILAKDGILDASAIDPKIVSGIDEAGKEITGNANKTYGELMKQMPTGVMGLVFAALVAAIVSSLASMMNSISTIFTMDIYRDYLAKDRSEAHYVRTGRITAAVAIIIAVLLAKPLLGSMESVFQAIQEYTGFVAPGIVAVFALGFFWKRTNKHGAFALLISSVVLSIIAELALGGLPFVIRIWFIFLICLAIGVVVSLMTPPPEAHQPVDIQGIDMSTTTGFKISSVIIALILAAIYVAYW